MDFWFGCPFLHHMRQTQRTPPPLRITSSTPPDYRVGFRMIFSNGWSVSLQNDKKNEKKKKKRNNKWGRPVSSRFPSFRIANRSTLMINMTNMRASFFCEINTMIYNEYSYYFFFSVDFVSLSPLLSLFTSSSLSLSLFFLLLSLLNSWPLFSSTQTTFFQTKRGSTQKKNTFRPAIRLFLALASSQLVTTITTTKKRIHFPLLFGEFDDSVVVRICVRTETHLHWYAWCDPIYLQWKGLHKT